MTSILGITLISGLAHAGGLSEISIQTGTFGVSGGAWTQVVDDARTVPGSGLRVALRLGGGDEPEARRRAIELVGDWDHQVRGAVVEVGGEGYPDERWDASFPSFHSKFVGNRVVVGPRLSYRFGRWFVPYASVQAGAWKGDLYLDDDTGSDDNTNQVELGGIAAVAVGMIGFDVRPFTIAGRYHVGSHLEMGYGHASTMNLESPDWAIPPSSVRFKGFALNWGIGIRM